MQSIDLKQLEKALNTYEGSMNFIIVFAAKAYLEEHKKAQELLDWSEGINTKEKLDQALKQ